MSLQTRLEALASALGADIKADRLTMTGLSSGSLAALTTTAKTSLLAAINEINAKSSYVDPWSYQSISAALTNTTSTAADIVTGFTAAANTRYVVEVLLSVTSAATTTGVQTTLAGPTTGITKAALKITSAITSATEQINYGALNGFQPTASGVVTPTLIAMSAIVEVGTPGAGNIKPQYKSEVPGSGVTINAGSYMRWRSI